MSEENIEHEETQGEDDGEEEISRIGITGKHVNEVDVEDEDGSIEESEEKKEGPAEKEVNEKSEDDDSPEVYVFEVNGEEFEMSPPEMVDTIAVQADAIGKASGIIKALQNDPFDALEKIFKVDLQKAAVDWVKRHAGDEAKAHKESPAEKLAREALERTQRLEEERELERQERFEREREKEVEKLEAILGEASWWASASSRLQRLVGSELYDEQMRLGRDLSKAEIRKIMDEVAAEVAPHLFKEEKKAPAPEKPKTKLPPAPGSSSRPAPSSSSGTSQPKKPARPISFEEGIAMKLRKSRG